MGDKKLAFPRWIKRTSCCACGREEKSYTPWWPDDKIHLYNGLPLCWTCARLIAMTFEKTFTPDIPVGSVPLNRDKVNGCDVGTYKRYLNDDKITMNSNIKNGDQMFESHCEALQNLKIINTSDQNWFSHLCEKLVKDVDQYEGIILKSEFVFDPEYYKVGYPVKVHLERDASNRYGLIKTVGTYMDIVFHDVLGNGKQNSIRITPDQVLKGWARITRMNEENDNEDDSINTATDSGESGEG